MSGISKSQVSRLCEEIDQRVKAFLDRPIEGDWPYLWIDATYVKVRLSGRIVSVAVIVAVGVNADGRREVLGMDIGASEAETFWTAFLRKLARRGLRGVKLVVSDAHEGSSRDHGTARCISARNTSRRVRLRLPPYSASEKLSCFIATSPPEMPLYQNHDTLRSLFRESLARCLIPDFDGALFSSAWRDALWAKFFMAAPRRQRRSVERYNIVKRA